MSKFHAIYGKGGVTPEPGGDLEPVLLWTNSNPTIGFDAQTVSLDLSDYAGVIIEFHQSNASMYGTRAYIKKNDNINGITGAGYPGAGSSTGLARNVTVTDSGIVFSAGIPNSDNNCIPNRIYGVKKYVVELDYGKHHAQWTAENSPYVLETDKPVQMIYFKNSSTASEYLAAYLNDDGTYSNYGTGYTFTKISDTKIKIGYSSSSENFASGTFEVYYIV